MQWTGICGVVIVMGPGAVLFLVSSEDQAAGTPGLEHYAALIAEAWAEWQVLLNSVGNSVGNDLFRQGTGWPWWAKAGLRGQTIWELLRPAASACAGGAC